MKKIILKRYNISKLFKAHKIIINWIKVCCRNNGYIIEYRCFEFRIFLIIKNEIKWKILLITFKKYVILIHANSKCSILLRY
jgi:hypothetical protein